MTSVGIRAPFAVLPVVVQVQHGSHGVHAQTVDVVFLYPVVGVGNEEALDFGLAPVEDVGAPVLVLALERVGVLIAAGAVEFVQTCGVLWEVGRHPVHDDAYSGGMALIHELHEVVGGAEPGGGREVAYLLISPASIVRIFADGHELDVGVAHFPDVGDKLLCELLIAEEVLAVLFPGAGVDLVDISGAVVDILCVEFIEVLLVGPLESFQVVELGRGVRAEFHVVPVGVRLEFYQPVLAFHAVFIVVVLLYPGDEELPDTAVAYLVHGVAASVPVVEIPDDADAPGVRRPHSEHGAGLPVLHISVRAEEFIRMGIFALVEQVQRNTVVFRNDDSHTARPPVVMLWSHIQPFRA